MNTHKDKGEEKDIRKMSFQEIMKLPKAESLYIKDLRWSMIWEKIKMRALLRPEDIDYFYEKLK